VLFDPLDRPLPSEDNNQSTTRDELVKMIEQDVKKINGKKLRLPID